MQDILTVFLSNGVLLLVVAILTEAATEIVKNLFPLGVVEDKITYAVSIAIGVALALAFDLNVFGLEGYGEYVSIVFAGLIASRGANYVNGFLKKFEVLR